MTEISRSVFRPREGAVLDLASLRVLASAPSELPVDWDGPPSGTNTAFGRLLRGARVLWLGNEACQ